MARPHRIHFPGALYHVLARGNQRQKIFREETDYLKYQERLAHYQKRFGFLLHVYVLMPNHVHLLIEVGSMPLSRVMQGLQFTYTQYFNRKYREVGHLFQGRYKAILCDKEAYLLELARYIHLNPVRAKLVRNPSEYCWSSYPVYLGRRREKMVHADFVLAQFGSKPSVARQAFERFVLENSRSGSREDLYEVKLQTFLGSEEFVERMPVRSHDEKKLYQITLDEIIEEIGRRYQMTKRDLKRRGRDRTPAEARHLIGYLSRELIGLPCSRVAETFGREAINFAAGVRRMEQRILEDAGFLRTIDKLSQSLRKGKKRKY